MKTQFAVEVLSVDDGWYPSCDYSFIKDGFVDKDFWLCFKMFLYDMIHGEEAVYSAWNNS